MQASTWIAIYLPIFIVLFVLIPSQRKKMVMAKIKKKKRGAVKVSNELINNCKGKVCNISSGSFGTSYNKVTIVDVEDNWIRAESKGKEVLINIDYIQEIKIITEK